jgi:hypothetical protein
LCRRRATIGGFTVIQSWALMAALCAGAATLGAAIDRFLMTSSKRRLYDWATATWLSLESRQLGDLPLFAARLVLRPYEWLASTRRRFILVFAPGSVLLTFSMALVGRLIRRAVFPYYEGDPPPGNLNDGVVLMHVGWFFDKAPKYIPLLVLNFAFDSATVLMTGVVVGAIARTRSTPRRFLLILVGAVLAYLLAVLCLTIAHLPAQRSLPGSFLQAMDVMWAFVSWRLSFRHAVHLDDAFYAATTLVPTLFLLMTIGAVGLARTAIGLSRRASLYGLELATQPHPGEIDGKFQPFGLFGLFLGAVGVVVKGVVDICVFFRQ